MTGFDLVAMGRTGVDIYPLEHGVGLEDVQTFQKFLGGSATNVAVAAARYGRRTALVTRRDRTRSAATCASRRSASAWTPPSSRPVTANPVTFCEVFPPDDFPLYFYRYPTAPDLQITAADLPLEAIRDAEVFWATVTGLSQEPSRAAHAVAWEARARRRHTILDLDYRPMFWADPAEASEEVGKALEHVTVAVGNREECEVAVGETDPQRAADALLERGLEILQPSSSRAPGGCWR